MSYTTLAGLGWEPRLLLAIYSALGTLTVPRVETWSQRSASITASSDMAQQPPPPPERKRLPTAQEPSALQKDDQCRTICVIGHVDHGKSSLVDWL